MESTRRKSLKNNLDPKITASFNTNSNCRIFMSSNSALSFKSLPNISSNSENFGHRLSQHVRSCSEIEPDISFKDTIKNNYETLNKKLNKKLNSIQDFFQEYVYSTKNCSKPISQSNLNISEPTLIVETPGSKSKSQDIYSMLIKQKPKKTDYYQINSKVLSVLASNHNLLKKTNIKDLNELILKASDQSVLNDKDFKIRERGKKFVKEPESSSSEQSEEEITNEQLNESQEDEDLHDYVPYYHRSYGLSGTYMLYDIPEEDIDEDTQDSLEIEEALNKK